MRTIERKEEMGRSSASIPPLTPDWLVVCGFGVLFGGWGLTLWVPTHSPEALGSVLVTEHIEKTMYAVIGILVAIWHGHLSQWEAI